MDRPDKLDGGRVFVESCRKCSAKYEFKLENEEIVTVLCGRPKEQKYKAVSYLWENHVPLPLECRRCLVVTTIPMRDASKLWRIVNFVGGGSFIWLDAMSIDQTDPLDLGAQLIVMGDIFTNAEIVSVFLPEADEKAYSLLKELGVAAAAVVERGKDFGILADDGYSLSPELHDTVAGLADEFLVQVRKWVANVHRWRYWRRAWTFQEWAMAAELEVTWETAEGGQGLQNVKNVIVEASTIVGYWRKITSRDSIEGTDAERLRNQVHVQEDVGRDTNIVSAHFPFRNFLVADESVNPENLRLMTFMTALPTASAMSTYVMENQLDEVTKFRMLLSLGLNAIHTSKREATYEADRVACWASMCNVDYDYKREDSFAVALHKAVAVLRRRGIRIYIFLPNTDCAETDLRFLEYAAAHRHINSRSKGCLLGASIFTGRADTISHIQYSLSQDLTVTHLEGNSDVDLQQVEKVIFKRPVLWSSNKEVVSLFRSVTSGKADGDRIFDVGDILEESLKDLSSTQLRKFLLITMSITVADIHTMWYFNAWAICPSTVELSSIFVARESLNGTLVLAVYKSPFPAKQAQIVSYLNMTHQRDGTYLIKTDEAGIVDIVFRTADTPEHELFWIPKMELRDMAEASLLPGWNALDVLSDRVFNMQISLSERRLMLA